MRAILLVPSEAHRDRLLATGPCEATPPMAWQHWHSGRWIAPGGKLSAVEFMKLEDDPPVALVLAWAGAVVAEGCDRAARVLRMSRGRPCGLNVTWMQTFAGWLNYSPDAFDCPDDADSYGVTPGESDYVDALVTPPADIGALLPAWALAIVCAARGLGEVVVIEGGTP